jgi:hypothetical protein
VLRDPARRTTLQDAARRRAAAFTWERTKDATLAELRRTLS